MKTRIEVKPYKHINERSCVFKRKLLIIFHMVAGKPPRVPKLIGMRYCNTSNGGIRNITRPRDFASAVTSVPCLSYTKFVKL